MLNLYIAPRGLRAPSPPDAAVTALLEWLAGEGILGHTADGAYPPGASVSRLFHPDALETHLPAELTFDALRVVRSMRPRFLPELRPLGTLQAHCRECGDVQDPEVLEEAVSRLRYQPVEKVTVTCAGCRSALGLRDLDFVHPVALARFWLFMEGAGLMRLHASVVERMGRLLGVSLAVVAEVPEETAEDWVPARRALRRR